MRKTITCVMAASAFAAMLGACSSIDCPLNSRVMTTCKFDQVFNDTLTVSVKRSDGNDSVLMNRLYDADSLAIPMSYNHDSDMLYFDFIDKDTKKHVYDTITVSKTNQPHFESVDCSPMVFHEITDVKHTSHKVESVKINNSYVTYDTQRAHLIISLKTPQ